MSKITRRKFIGGGIGAGISLLTHAFPSALFAKGKETAGRSVVGIAKGLNIPAITKEAIDLAGGMYSVVRPGQKVFIKPNYIAGGFMGHDPVTAGEIPHPQVVATVAEECVKCGAKYVLIGEWFERPLRIEFGGREGKYGAQLTRHIEIINRKYGNKVYVLDLRKNTSFFRYVPSRTPLKRIAVPDLVCEADTVISVAVLKTHHRPVSVTFGMKNFIGVMPSVLYGEPRVKLHDAGINQIIVDIVREIRPKLCVISGVFGMEGEGVVLSFGGKPVDLSQRLGAYLVIAGRDHVATDATAARLITKHWQPRPVNEEWGVPWYIHHLRLGFLQRIGEIRKSRIAVRGAALEETAMSWEMPRNNTYPELPNHVL